MLPKPKKDESRADFILRMVQDKSLQGRYSKEDLHWMANSLWKKHKGELAPLYCVKALIVGNVPVCSDDECEYQRVCANHETAGPKRFKKGRTPDLRQVALNSWRCSKCPRKKKGGAITCDD